MHTHRQCTIRTYRYMACRWNGIVPAPASALLAHSLTNLIVFVVVLLKCNRISGMRQPCTDTHADRRMAHTLTHQNDTHTRHTRHTVSDTQRLLLLQPVPRLVVACFWSCTSDMSTWQLHVLTFVLRCGANFLFKPNYKQTSHFQYVLHCFLIVFFYL